MPMGLHGIPRLFPRHSTGNRGHFTGFRGHSTGFHGHSMGFHGMPRQLAEHRGGPRHYHGNFHGNLHGNLHGNPRQALTAYHGRPRYSGKTHGNAYGVGVAMQYTVAVVVVLPSVAMDGTTEIASDRTAARAMATTVALAVEAPCTMESRGPCRGNPRISTVVRGKTHGKPRKCHGNCRGPPPKSQIMCICEFSCCASS